VRKARTVPGAIGKNPDAPRSVIRAGTSRSHAAMAEQARRPRVGRHAFETTHVTNATSPAASSAARARGAAQRTAAKSSSGGSRSKTSRAPRGEGAGGRAGCRAASLE